MDRIGRCGQAPGRSDCGEADRRRTEAVGRDLPLAVRPLPARCPQLPLLGIVKPRARLHRRSRLNPSGRSGWRSARPPCAVAMAESSAHHHFGVCRRLDNRHLRILARLPPPRDGARSAAQVWRGEAGATRRHGRALNKGRHGHSSHGQGRDSYGHQSRAMAASNFDARVG